MNFFSVIIPVYNSKNIIQKSLQCLEEQTYKNFEVIIIDDCSNDGTYDYLISYKEKSSLNIRVIKNKENVGPGMSRNHGVSITKGNYIAFIDSDDWYEKDFLRIVNKEITERKCEILLFDYYRCYSSRKKQWIKCTNIFEDNVNINTYIGLAFETLCSCVFSTTLIKDNPIPILYKSEEAAALPLLLSSASVISHIKVPLYNYLYRRNLLLTSQNTRIYKGSIAASSFIDENVSQKYNDEKKFRGINLVLYGAVYKAIESHVSSHDIKEIISSFENSHPNCYNNKYLIFYPLRKRIFCSSLKKTA